MKIIIEAKPASSMRYETEGDWYYHSDGSLQIEVDDSLGDNAQFLVALHELVEAKLCSEHNISQEAVDEFDFSYEGDAEPGDDPEAPYYDEHRFALLIEGMMAFPLGL